MRDEWASSATSRGRLGAIVPQVCLGEAAVIAGRADAFLGGRCRRIARRCARKNAMVAVGRSILVILWQLLADPEIEAKKRSHI